MFTYTMGPAVVVYRQSLWNTVTIYPCYSIIIHQSFCWTTVLGGLIPVIKWVAVTAPVASRRSRLRFTHFLYSPNMDAL